MALYYAQYLTLFVLAGLTGSWLGQEAWQGHRGRAAVALTAVCVSIVGTALVSAQLVRGCP